MSRQARSQARVPSAKEHVLEGRRKSSCKTKTEGDRRGGVEKVLRSAGGEERDGAMLVLRVFDVVAAFLVPLPCKLTADFGGPTNRSAEKWSRHVNLMVSLLWTSTAIRQQPPTGSTPDHPGSRDPHPRRSSVKRRSPYARRGVRSGQIFVFLAREKVRT